MQKRPVINLISGVALATLLVLSGVASGQEPPDDPVLVEIGDERVRLSEFLAYYALLRPQADFSALPAETQQRELDEYMERRLLAARARDLGLQAEPSTRQRIQFMSDGVLAEALRQQMMNSIDVNTAERQRYYNEFQHEFWVEPRMLLEHVVYRDSFSAEQAIEQFSKGKGYIDLVDEKQRDPDLVYSRRGWLTPPLLISELRETVVAQEPGSIAPIMRSNYGYHVVRMIEKEPGYYRPFDEVQQQLTSKVQRQKAAAQHQELLKNIRAAKKARSYLQQLRDQGVL